MKYATFQDSISPLFVYCLVAMGACFGQSIALTNATVADGNGAIRNGETIVIENGRIASVGPAVMVPKGASIVDLEGRVVAPGLFDLHTHLP